MYTAVYTVQTLNIIYRKQQGTHVRIDNVGKLDADTAEYTIEIENVTNLFVANMILQRIILFKGYESSSNSSAARADGCYPPHRWFERT